MHSYHWVRDRVCCVEQMANGAVMCELRSGHLVDLRDDSVRASRPSDRLQPPPSILHRANARDEGWMFALEARPGDELWKWITTPDDRPGGARSGWRRARVLRKLTIGGTAAYELQLADGTKREALLIGDGSSRFSELRPAEGWLAAFDLDTITPEVVE
jgi:hypothetical protein